MSQNAKNYEYVSYEEFESIQMSENKYKLEYDNGYIYYMSPVYPNHDRVKNKIAFSIMNYISQSNGKCEVFTSDVAVVFEDKTGKYEYEPDVMVCCNPEKFKGSKYVGIPALIVEILSHSTEHRDKGVKLENYKKFGVKEYWIVDINEGKIKVYNNNLDGEYLSVNAYTSEMEISCMGKFSIKVDDIFSVIK